MIGVPFAIGSLEGAVGDVGFGVVVGFVTVVGPAGATVGIYLKCRHDPRVSIEIGLKYCSFEHMTGTQIVQRSRNTLNKARQAMTVPPDAISDAPQVVYAAAQIEQAVTYVEMAVAAYDEVVASNEDGQVTSSISG